ncbi:MAG: DUF6788 family protein, partial [Steroidobacteraceae bacterium]
MASRQARTRKRQILDEITRLDFCLPGSLVERTTRCSTPTCHCQQDPTQRHGPYPSWIRKVGARTVTHTLTPEQAKQYRPWFDNTRRLRELVGELEAVSAQVAADNEGWENGIADDGGRSGRRRRSRER